MLLSAGAIGSPAILERSGIGDGSRLADLGIAPLIDRPEVGGNLQDHLQLRCAFRVSNVPTLNHRASNIFGKALIGMEYILRRTGPMAMTCCLGRAFS